MDAYLRSTQIRANSFDPPPVLIVGDTELVRTRGRATVAQAGLRIADSVAVNGALDRIGRQVGTSALWIELDDEIDSMTRDLLDRVASGVGEGRYAAVVSALGRLLDQLAVHVFDRGMEVIVDADDVERALPWRWRFREQCGQTGFPM